MPELVDAIQHFSLMRMCDGPVDNMPLEVVAMPNADRLRL
jgi:hypothetical protein